MAMVAAASTVECREHRPTLWPFLFSSNEFCVHVVAFDSGYLSMCAHETKFFAIDAKMAAVRVDAMRMGERE